MKKILVVLALVMILVSFNPTMAAGEALPSGIKKDDLSENVDKFFEEHKNNAGALAFIAFGKDEAIIEKYYGYIDKNSNLKTDKDSVFEWGSIYKLFVWTSIMQLKEEGKLDLDTDIRNYLPKTILTKLRFEKPIPSSI